MKIASDAKTVDNLPIRSSAANFVANSVSANLYSKGAEGTYLLKAASIFAMEDCMFELGFSFIITQFTLS